MPIYIYIYILSEGQKLLYHFGPYLSSMPNSKELINTAKLVSISCSE